MTNVEKDGTVLESHTPVIPVLAANGRQAQTNQGGSGIRENYSTGPNSLRLKILPASR